jgi:beta-lactamase regulating signal transducer with metallopeptidase domain
MSEVTAGFVIANVAVSCAILAIILLRKPIRLGFGAKTAYALWLLVPFAALAGFLPRRVVSIKLPATEPVLALPTALEPAPFDIPADVPMLTPAPAEITPPSFVIDPVQIALIVWLVGIAAMMIWLLRAQSRFQADVRAGFAGPAVVGVLRPRIVTPSDFEDRFDAPERTVILAHETIHLTRNDARINALVALSRCVLWFNPLIHIAAHLLRIDQEMACDAAVVERHPRAKALYASALLKAQLAARPLPLGCYWPAGTQHPLMERIEMLKKTSPGRLRRMAGVAALAVLACGAGVTAWAARPTAVRYVHEEAADQPQPERIFNSPAPAPIPVPQTPAPQAATFAPPASAYYAPDLDALMNRKAPAGYDEPVMVWGKVERLDFGDNTYTAIVRATGIASRDPGDRFSPLRGRPNSQVWRLSATPVFGDQAAMTKDLVGKEVQASGFQSKDKTCKPECLISVSVLKVEKSTEVPQFGPGSLLNQFAAYYDTSNPTVVQGAVERVAFSDRTLDIYVRDAARLADGSPRVGPGAGKLWQIRIEYRQPRANIEAALKGQYIIAQGWRAREGLATICGPVCGIYATSIIFEDKRPFTPAGEKLFSDRTTNMPGPAMQGGLPVLPAPILVPTGPASAPAPQPMRYEPQQAPQTALPATANETKALTTLQLRRAATAALLVDLRQRYSERHPEIVRTQIDLADLDRQIAFLGSLPWILQDRADPASQATLRGVITSVQWVNPSTIIHVKENGSGMAWAISTATPNSLLRSGATKAILKVGTAVTAVGLRPTSKACGDECILYASPAQMTFDGAPLPNIETTDAIQPTRFEPPAAPVSPPLAPTFASKFDANDPLLLKGTVERTEADASQIVIWVRADEGSPTGSSAAAPAWPAKALWRVATSNAGSLTAAKLQADLVGKPVTVRGYRTIDKSCASYCEMNGRDAILPAATTLSLEGRRQATPQPTLFDPPSGYYPFAKYFDGDDPIIVSAKILRVDYVDPYAQVIAEGYVSAAPNTGKVGEASATQTWKINLPPPSKLDDAYRARLGAGATIVVRGYNAKDKTCNTTCWMSARDITFADGQKLLMPSSTGTPAPAAPAPVVEGNGPMESPEPDPQGPPRLPTSGDYQSNNYDRSDEIKLTGEIQDVSTDNGETVVWVFAKDIAKAGFGARPGQDPPTNGEGMLWRIVGPGLGKIQAKDLPKLAPGQKVLVAGFNAADKSCKPTCRMQARSIAFK